MNHCRDCEDYSFGMGSGQCPRCRSQDLAETSARSFDIECEKATHILGEALHGPSKIGWNRASPLQLAQGAANAIKSRNETITKLQKEIEELKSQLEIQNLYGY